MTGIEPPPDSDLTPWPRCEAHVEVLGMCLDCTLPALHDYDDQPEHEASNGCRWSLTATTHDGQRITLRGAPRLN